MQAACEQGLHDADQRDFAIVSVTSDAPVRLLHLHSTFAPGGKERRAVRLMNAFGPKVHHAIVSAIPEETGAAAEIDRSIPVTWPRKFPALKGSPTPGRLKLIAEAMRGYDLVLTYNWGAMDAVMAHTLFGQMLDLPPLIHHEDGFSDDERVRLSRRRNWYRRIGLGRARALVVPSETLEEIALTAWAQPIGRVRRIPNGIDTAAFAGEPRPDALPGLVKRPGEFWIGTMAGLRSVKNLTALVRASAPLPEFCHLVIVGEGPERDAIRAEAERLGVEHRIHLPGFAAQPERYVGLFDVFSLSSHSEQFPISLVEAMAAYKLNKLHLHLADDEGWRIEIPALPELAEIRIDKTLVLALPVTLPGAAWAWLAEGSVGRPELHPSTWWAFGYVALFSSWLGFFAWYAALARDPMRVSQLQLLQPFAAMALSAWLLGENVSPWAPVFAIGVAVSVWVGQRMIQPR